MNRVRDLSSDQDAFKAAMPYYEDALSQSGYVNCTAEFMEDSNSNKQKRKRSRKRNILWFNPPYSVDVETDVGRRFLNLVVKHFPSSHRYHKFINKNSVKVSYSCMRNVENIIKSHNKILLKQQQDQETKRSCNCRSKTQCPLNGQCLNESVIYEAKVQAGSEEHTYIGMTEGTFKTRYNNHTHSLRHSKQRSSTKLSEKIWDLKDKGRDFTLSWKILRRASPYRNGARTCDLCTTEKLEILLRSTDLRLLNSRCEIMAKCRHKRKFIL